MFPLILSLLISRLSHSPFTFLPNSETNMEPAPAEIEKQAFVKYFKAPNIFHLVNLLMLF